MSILIVDDSVIDSVYLEHLLKKAGYIEMYSATSAKRAFQILKREDLNLTMTSNIDLILMDIEMPDMSGIEACRLIKSTEQIKDIPIIMVTGRQDMNSFQLALSVGALDYIVKPVKEADLIPKVYSALKLKSEMDLRKARERELIETNRLLHLEREKTEQLIHNILPDKIARDLKVHGKTKPETYEKVTVYLSDIVRFTEFSSMLDAESLIEELNDMFTAFDYIMEKNNCERIKTIGDAYMAVSGMPEHDPRHAENMVKSATEIINYLIERNKENFMKWEIRVGIHSGRVVGSVVGVKKYIYDIFGDTVNTTARMESNSDPMKINISDVTYELVKDTFHCIERRPVLVKGKGLMKMYFVEKPIKQETQNEFITLSEFFKQ